MLPNEVQSIEYAMSNVDSVMMREEDMIQRNKSNNHVRKTTKLLQQQGVLAKKGETREIGGNIMQQLMQKVFY